MSTRQEALAAGKKRYRGSPCRLCGNTERYVRNSQCTQCKGVRKDESALTSGSVAKSRAEAKASGQKTYHGFPCKICDGTERYSKSGACFGCMEERRRVKKEVGHMIKRMASVVAVVRQHLMASALSNYPETKLAIAVFEQAAMDVFDDHECVSSARYLLGDMVGLQLCGIDPDWVRRLLAGNGLYDFVVERVKRRKRG